MLSRQPYTAVRPPAQFAFAQNQTSDSSSNVKVSVLEATLDADDETTGGGLEVEVEAP